MKLGSSWRHHQALWMLKQTGLTLAAWPHFASFQSPNQSLRHKESHPVYKSVSQIKSECQMWCFLSGRAAWMGLQCALQQFSYQSMTGKWSGSICGQYLQIFLESNSFKWEVTKLVSTQLAWGCNTLFTRPEQQLYPAQRAVWVLPCCRIYLFWSSFSSFSVKTGDKYLCQLSKIPTQNIGRWAQLQD